MCSSFALSVKLLCTWTIMWIHRNTHEEKKYLKAAAQKRTEICLAIKMLRSLYTKQGNVLVRHPILELAKLFSKAGWVFILSTSGNIYGVLVWIRWVGFFLAVTIFPRHFIWWSCFPYLFIFCVDGTPSTWTGRAHISIYNWKPEIVFQFSFFNKCSRASIHAHVMSTGIENISFK